MIRGDNRKMSDAGTISTGRQHKVLIMNSGIFRHLYQKILALSCEAFGFVRIFQHLYFSLRIFSNQQKSDPGHLLRGGVSLYTTVIASIYDQGYLCIRQRHPQYRRVTIPVKKRLQISSFLPYFVR